MRAMAAGGIGCGVRLGVRVVAVRGRIPQTRPRMAFKDTCNKCGRAVAQVTIAGGVEFARAIPAELIACCYDGDTTRDEWPQRSPWRHEDPAWTQS